MRNSIIKEVKNKTDLSARNLALLLGISKDIIFRT